MPTPIRLPPRARAPSQPPGRQDRAYKAFYLREIIESGPEDAEDAYLASGVLDRVRTGKERVFTLDEVEHDLGLED